MVFIHWKKGVGKVQMGSYSPLPLMGCCDSTATWVWQVAATTSSPASFLHPCGLPTVLLQAVPDWWVLIRPHRELAQGVTTSRNQVLHQNRHELHQLILVCTERCQREQWDTPTPLGAPAWHSSGFPSVPHSNQLQFLGKETGTS